MILGNAGPDPFGEFPLEERIAARAEACGINLGEGSVSALAGHARAVLRVNPELHLTSITEPEDFLERHIGEGFEGAARLDAGIEGQLLDLGSGNGYPGLPLAAARPGLELILAEASRAKAGFLRETLREIAFPRATVLEAQVQRPGDLEDVGCLRLITSRAMGGWAKILPRLARCLGDGGEVLLWAGPEVESIAARTAWRKYALVDRTTLPGRDQSWIWRFHRR